MTGFLFDVFIVKIVEFVGAAMLLISLWPDAVVNTIMHAKNLFYYTIRYCVFNLQ